MTPTTRGAPRTDGERHVFAATCAVGHRESAANGALACRSNPQNWHISSYGWVSLRDHWPRVACAKRSACRAIDHSAEPQKPATRLRGNPCTRSGFVRPGRIEHGLLGSFWARRAARMLHVCHARNQTIPGVPHHRYRDGWPIAQGLDCKPRRVPVVYRDRQGTTGPKMGVRGVSRGLNEKAAPRTVVAVRGAERPTGTDANHARTWPVVAPNTD